MLLQYGHQEEIILLLPSLPEEGFFIGLMRPDGSEERLIAEGYLTEGPTWAPGGRVLSFFRQIPQQNGNMKTRLFVIDITGYRERELNTPEDASDPAWSPKNIN